MSGEDLDQRVIRLETITIRLEEALARMLEQNELMRRALERSEDRVLRLLAGLRKALGE